MEGGIVGCVPCFYWNWNAWVLFFYCAKLSLLLTKFVLRIYHLVRRSVVFCLFSASEPFAVNRSSLLNDLVQAAKPNNQQLSDKENQQIGGDDEPPSMFMRLAWKIKPNNNWMAVILVTWMLLSGLGAFDDDDGEKEKTFFYSEQLLRNRYPVTLI